MEYQKIINLLDNTLNQPSKFKRKKWLIRKNGCDDDCYIV